MTVPLKQKTDHDKEVKITIKVQECTRVRLSFPFPSRQIG